MRSIRLVFYIWLVLTTTSCTVYRLAGRDLEYINVTKYGFIGDGRFDNSQLFKKLNAILAASPNRNVVVFFPEGIYCTNQGLEVYDKNYVCIRGKKAMIQKIALNWNADNVALYIVDSKGIEINGLSIDMSVKDFNTPTNTAYRYYAIWCRMDNIPSEKIDIHNCTFIDNLSVPNSTVKPYNGTIWLGSYGKRGCNVSITNNVFENSCGRVIYTTNMSDITIAYNTINNASYLSYDCKHINQELICFRQLGCENVVIRNNRLIMSPSAYIFASHKVFEINCNDYDYLPLRNCVISDNYIDCSNAPDDVSCIVFHCEAGDKIRCEHNTVALNKSRGSYWLYFNRTQNYHVLKNVMISDNEVWGACESSILINGGKSVENVTIDNNQFHVDKSFGSFHLNEIFGESKVRFNKNKILK